MSRAVRRQEKNAPKDGPVVPKRRGSMSFRVPKQATRGAQAPKAAAGAKRSFRPKTPAWMADIISELKKVSWPTRQETVYLTTVVIIVTLVVGTVLGGIDLGFNWLIDHLLLR